MSRDALGGVTFELPDGWTAEHQVVLRLGVPDDATGFEANVVVARRPAPAGATVDALAETRCRELSQELTALVPGELRLAQLCGQRAVRIGYRWGEGAALAQLIVLSVIGRWVYEVTFTDSAARYAESVGAFERWLAGLQIAAPSGSQLGALGLAAFSRPR